MRHTATVILICALGLAGCATRPDTKSSNAPLEKDRVFAASYDKTWAAMLRAAQDEGITLSAIDKSSGIANGMKNLTPSTMDMIAHYSTRYLVFINVRKVTANKSNVAINIKGERKYKERGWRPGGNSAGYSTILLNKIAANL